MKLYIAVICLIFSTFDHVTSSHGNKHHCNHRRLRRCASAISHFTIPMIESSNSDDFKNPHKTVTKFCRKVYPKLNCVYNQLTSCEGEVVAQGLEDKAGILSHVCGEGRKDLISGSTCWLDNNVAARLRHCRQKHNVDDVIGMAHADNITNTFQICSTLDDYVWSCVGDWTMKRCQYNLASFLMRLVNPEAITHKLKC